MEHFSLIRAFTRFAMLGAEWVMWLLIALSVVSIGIMVERVVYLRGLRDDLGRLADILRARLRAGDEDSAREALRASPSPAALVALAGLNEIDRGAHAAERIMNSATARVRQQLERNLAVLGTIGNNAPFVGLFGTVIGIVQSFDALKPPPGLQGAAAAAAQSAATGRVMGTIAEALVATAIGLLVAIPAVAAYNYFQRAVRAILAGTEVLSQIVLASAHAEDPDEGLGALVRLLRGDPPRSARAHDAPDVTIGETIELPASELHSEGATNGLAEAS